MTQVGAPTEWAKNFRSLDIRFLECVAKVWSRCLATLSNQPKEDIITANLVDILFKDPQCRRQFYHIEYQFEPFGYTSEGMAYSKGRIDMAVLLDQDREKYLAYECKRLNVVRNGRKNSQATDYVYGGVLRFVREQYAEDLPVGCMLGYVLDGDVEFADSRVREAITAKKDKIGLVVASIQDMPPIGCITRFSSQHIRPSSNTKIEIRHALLAFPVVSTGH